jgi:hypothetical protein
MSSPTYGSLFEYYRDQSILPTYGQFKWVSDLDRYRRERTRFFTQRLYLPPSTFRGGRLIEFGPDSGENALVFAGWGASCFLVEPNKRAHPFLLNHFRDFNLSDKLEGVSDSDVTGFLVSAEQEGKFDVLDAEGFIYTVRPERPWMELFARLLKPGGISILSYMEMSGSFFELLLRAIQAHACRVTGWDANRTARHLFTAKWNSIPHTRSFESWVMDVLENPFVRLPFLFDPLDLCEMMASSGFSLYSSWPLYRNPLEVGWHKKEVSINAQMASMKTFLEMNSMSLFFGGPFFSIRPAPVSCIKKAVERVDALIDTIDYTCVMELKRCLEEMQRWLGGGDFYTHPLDLQKAMVSLESVRHILDLLVAGDISSLERFCNSDLGFIGMWGMPVHFSVFEKQ